MLRLIQKILPRVFRHPQKAARDKCGVLRYSPRVGRTFIIVGILFVVVMAGFITAPSAFGQFINPADPIMQYSSGVGVAAAQATESIWGSIVDFTFSSIAHGISNIGLAVDSMLAKVLLVFIDILIDIVQYNDFGNSPAIDKGWVVLRDVSNMFFIMVLLLIAFATILRIESYKYNRLLGKLVIMVILINFSKTISLLLIDASQVVTLTFVNAFAQIAYVNLTDALKLRGMLDFVPPTAVGGDAAGALASTPNAPSNWELITLPLFVFALLLVGCMVVLALVAVFLIRIITLWVLVILSPLAFLLATIPAGQRYSSQWWSTLGKWLVYGPIIAFFLWLSLAILPSGTPNLLPTPTGNEASQANTSVISASISGVSSSSAILSFMLAIILMMMSLAVAGSLGGAAGAIAGKMSQRVMGMGKGVLRLGGAPIKGAFGLAKYGARSGGRWAARKFIHENDSGFGRTMRVLTPTYWKGFAQRGEHLDKDAKELTMAAGRRRADRTFVGDEGTLDWEEIARRNQIGTLVSDIRKAQGPAADVRQHSMEMVLTMWYRGNSDDDMKHKSAAMFNSLGQGNWDDSFEDFGERYFSDDEFKQEFLKKAGTLGYTEADIKELFTTEDEESLLTFEDIYMGIHRDISEGGLEGALKHKDDLHFLRAGKELVAGGQAAAERGHPEQQGWFIDPETGVPYRMSKEDRLKENITTFRKGAGRTGMSKISTHPFKQRVWSEVLDPETGEVVRDKDGKAKMAYQIVGRIEEGSTQAQWVRDTFDNSQAGEVRQFAPRFLNEVFGRYFDDVGNYITNDKVAQHRGFKDAKDLQENYEKIFLNDKNAQFWTAAYNAKFFGAPTAKPENGYPWLSGYRHRPQVKDTENSFEALQDGIKYPDVEHAVSGSLDVTAPQTIKTLAEVKKNLLVDPRYGARKGLINRADIESAASDLDIELHWDENATNPETGGRGYWGDPRPVIDKLRNYLIAHQERELRGKLVDALSGKVIDTKGKTLSRESDRVEIERLANSLMAAGTVHPAGSPLGDISQEAYDATRKKMEEYAAATGDADNFFVSKEYEDGVAAGTLLEETAYRQAEKVQRYQAEHGTKGIRGIGSFGAGSRNTIGFDFGNVEIEGVDLKNMAGDYLTDPEALAKVKPKLVAMIDEEMAKLNALPENERTAGTAQRVQALEAAKSRLSDPEQAKDLKLFNTGRKGFSSRHVLAHEDMHAQLEAVDPNQELQRQLWDSLAAEEKQTIMEQLKRKMNNMNLSEADAMQEYFAEGLANAGKRTWADQGPDAIELKKEFRDALAGTVTPAGTRPTLAPEDRGPNYIHDLLTKADPGQAMQQKLWQKINKAQRDAIVDQMRRKTKNDSLDEQGAMRRYFEEGFVNAGGGALSDRSPDAVKLDPATRQALAAKLKPLMKPTPLSADIGMPLPETYTFDLPKKITWATVLKARMKKRVDDTAGRWAAQRDERAAAKAEERAAKEEQKERERLAKRRDKLQPGLEQANTAATEATATAAERRREYEEKRRQLEQVKTSHQQTERQLARQANDLDAEYDAAVARMERAATPEERRQHADRANALREQKRGIGRELENSQRTVAAAEAEAERARQAAQAAMAEAKAKGDVRLEKQREYDEVAGARTERQVVEEARGNAATLGGNNLVADRDLSEFKRGLSHRQYGDAGAALEHMKETATEKVGTLAQEAQKLEEQIASAQQSLAEEFLPGTLTAAERKNLNVGMPSWQQKLASLKKQIEGGKESLADIDRVIGNLNKLAEEVPAGEPVETAPEAEEKWHSDWRKRRDAANQAAPAPGGASAATGQPTAPAPAAGTDAANAAPAETAAPAAETPSAESEKESPSSAPVNLEELLGHMGKLTEAVTVTSEEIGRIASAVDSSLGTLDTTFTDLTAQLKGLPEQEKQSAEQLRSMIGGLRQQSNTAIRTGDAELQKRTLWETKRLIKAMQTSAQVDGTMTEAYHSVSNALRRQADGQSSESVE